MKKIIVAIIVLILSTSINALEPEYDKQYLLQVESDMIELLHERHKLAGEALKARDNILDAKKRATPENKYEMERIVEMNNRLLHEKNEAIKAKNLLIKEKANELKELMPKKNPNKQNIHKADITLGPKTLYAGKPLYIKVKLQAPEINNVTAVFPNGKVVLSKVNSEDWRGTYTIPKSYRGTKNLKIYAKHSNGKVDLHTKSFKVSAPK